MRNDKDWVRLKFTPLEFETARGNEYRLGLSRLKFTPLEFDTADALALTFFDKIAPLKFTPLEFETLLFHSGKTAYTPLKFTPLEFETRRRTRKA